MEMEFLLYTENIHHKQFDYFVDICFCCCKSYLFFDTLPSTSTKFNTLYLKFVIISMINLFFSNNFPNPIKEIYALFVCFKERALINPIYFFLIYKFI